MSKTTKAQRKALDAIDDAESAAKKARRVAKTLPGKSAKKLREVAAETVDDVDVSKKAIRKNPRKVAKKANRAEERVRKATRAAVAKAEKKARLRAEAERAAAEAAKAAEDAASRAAEAKALKKAAAKAERAAAKAEQQALEADRVLEAELTSGETGTDAATAVEAEPAVADAPGEHAAAATGSSDLNALTVAQLRERARAAGRTGYSRLTKAELITLLS